MPWVLTECSLIALWLLFDCSLTALGVLSETDCSLTALWLLPDCSLIAPWLLPDCSLTAHWFLTDCLMIWDWFELKRLRNSTLSRTDRRTERLLGLLSEPKIWLKELRAMYSWKLGGDLLSISVAALHFVPYELGCDLLALRWLHSNLSHMN